jgi:hypothetical protein
VSRKAAETEPASPVTLRQGAGYASVAALDVRAKRQPAGGACGTSQAKGLWGAASREGWTAAPPHPPAASDATAARSANLPLEVAVTVAWTAVVVGVLVSAVVLRYRARGAG